MTFLHGAMHNAHANEPMLAGAPALGLMSSGNPGAEGPDAVEAYFECITTCSLEDGECVTHCVEMLRASTDQQD